MKQYLDMLEHLLTQGKDRPDRTGTGTRGVFIYQMKFNLAEGFPLLTTKKIFTKGVIHELIWFLHGDTNIRYLVQHGVHIWTAWPLKHWLKETGQFVPVPNSPEWNIRLDEFEGRIVGDDAFAVKWGDCGPVYGHQWRRWSIKPPAANDYHAAAQALMGETAHIDQIANLIDGLKKEPFGRRHIVSAWNTADIPDMVVSGLPPCHTLWQCYVEEMGSFHDGVTTFPERRVSLHLYARSIDSFLGLPFNIASYAFLLTMLARVTDMTPGTLGISFGDLHLYKNHFEQAQLQLTRDPRPLPKLVLPKKEKIEDYVYEDFQIVGYDPHPVIKGDISV